MTPKAWPRGRKQKVKLYTPRQRKAARDAIDSNKRAERTLELAAAKLLKPSPHIDRALEGCRDV